MRMWPGKPDVRAGSLLGHSHWASVGRVGGGLRLTSAQSMSGLANSVGDMLRALATSRGERVLAHAAILTSSSRNTHPTLSNRLFARMSQRCEIPRPKRRIAESCRAFKMCFMSLMKGKRTGQSLNLHAFLRAGNASVLPPTIDFDAAILGLSFCPPAACLLCLARPCDASHWPTCTPLHLAACWSICAHQIQAF